MPFDHILFLQHFKKIYINYVDSCGTISKGPITISNRFKNADKIKAKLWSQPINDYLLFETYLEKNLKMDKKLIITHCRKITIEYENGAALEKQILVMSQCADIYNNYIANNNNYDVEKLIDICKFYIIPNAFSTNSYCQNIFDNIRFNKPIMPVSLKNLRIAIVEILCNAIKKISSFILVICLITILDIHKISTEYCFLNLCLYHIKILIYDQHIINLNEKLMQIKKKIESYKINCYKVQYETQFPSLNITKPYELLIDTQRIYVKYNANFSFFTPIVPLYFLVSSHVFYKVIYECDTYSKVIYSNINLRNVIDKMDTIADEVVRYNITKALEKIDI